MAQVFLSYQKRDRALAERVSEALRARGISVWWDQDVTPRESWDRILEREIMAAAFVLVLWTKHSVESEWVRIEAHYAARECKPGKLVQARVGDCDIPLAYRLIQYVELEPDRPEASEGWPTLLWWLDASGHAGPPPRPGGAVAEPISESTRAPSAGSLPLFYRELQPLSSTLHSRFRLRSSDRAPYLAMEKAIPLTTDEFIAGQRHFPIVFSTDETPVPLALMGLNEGVNVFVDSAGRPLNPMYVPAYVRRYPFLLARLEPESEELSLCFDPTSDLVGDYEDGERLFDGGKLSEKTGEILKFCEDFEIAAQRTTAFVQELHDMVLLIDGEVSIESDDGGQPFLYRGFRMVDEERLRNLSGTQLERINQNGMWALIMAHLFSLSLIRDLFARQRQQGKVPR